MKRAILTFSSLQLIILYGFAVPSCTWVKKLSFIIGQQHHLCMNYFIDEHYLRLDEKNLFTRIELSTLFLSI